MFGVSLEDVVQAYQQEPGSLPVLVAELIAFLKKFGTSVILVEA